MAQRLGQNGVLVVERATMAKDGMLGRSRLELRSATQERVLEFTEARRAELYSQLRAAHPDKTDDMVWALVDQMQPLYAEWDPVVELGVLAADHRNSAELRRSAMAEQAQYLRPKLKSVEHTADPAALEIMEQKNALAARLVALLDASAAAKRDMVVEGTFSEVARESTGESTDGPSPDTVRESQ